MKKNYSVLQTVCTVLHTAEHLKFLEFNKYQVYYFLINFLFSKLTNNLSVCLSCLFQFLVKTFNISGEEASTAADRRL